MKEAKLWKRVLFEGIRPAIEADPVFLEGLTKAIISSPIIVDRVSQEDSTDIRAVDFERYKFMSLPFGLFFVEGPIGAEDGRWGSLVQVFKLESGFKVNIARIVSKPNYKPTLIQTVYVLLDKDGSLTTDGSNRVGYAAANLNQWMLENLERKKLDAEYLIGKSVREAIASTFDVVLHLSCKNVQLEQVDPDAKTARIATKRHGESKTGYRYHILTVRPPGSKPGTKGEPIGEMPRHVCRGHFSEYGPQFGKGKLFGKLEGRFFIPPHMRGKAENGIVEKDYRV